MLGPFRCLLPIFRHSLFARVYPTTRRISTTPHTVQRIFSGIQPTGEVHLGNYLGAIANWVNLQNEHPHKVILSVVDLHSLTAGPEPRLLEESTWNVLATLLAAGIDPTKTIIFNQSKVSAHVELAWILNCFTPLYKLKTMTQYKEKSKDETEAFAGLLNYPVLMTADILLYKATHVPVGEDQTQHMDLARFLADRFNKKYHDNFFPIPQILLTSTKRVMSLTDPSKKMSKSDPNSRSKINLTDSADDIRQKITKAKTDSIMGITWDPTQRPEVANLLQIFSALSGRTIEDICQEFAAKDMLVFKNALIDVLVSTICPIGKKIGELRKDKVYLTKVLDEGSHKAHQIAIQTMKEVRQLVGLI